MSTDEWLQIDGHLVKKPRKLWFSVGNGGVELKVIGWVDDNATVVCEYEAGLMLRARTANLRVGELTGGGILWLSREIAEQVSERLRLWREIRERFQIMSARKVASGEESICKLRALAKILGIDGV